MQLALLGVDRDTLAIVRAAQNAGHEITWLATDEESTRALATFAPRVRRMDEWESLLAPGRCDGVLASLPSDPGRDEQLRRLVQAAVPLLVVHPAIEAIVGFELDMIRGDTGGVVIPYFPGCRHPALARLPRFSAPDSPLGGIELVTLERRLPERSRRAVLTAFTQDVDILRRAIGAITRVSGMAPGEGDSAFANLSVQMSSSGPAVARWSAGPTNGDSEAELVLTGPGGQARLQMPADERQWKWIVNGEPAPDSDYTSWNGPLETFSLFLGAMKGSATEAAAARPFEWSDACRACELAEAVERSVRRGRTVELHLETHSEEETFKGVMAAGGCLLVMLALAGLLIASLAGGLQLPSTAERLAARTAEEQPPSLSIWLRIAPVYPFVIFLALQLLRLVFRRAKSDPRSSSAGSQ